MIVAEDGRHPSTGSRSWRAADGPAVTMINGSGWTNVGDDVLTLSISKALQQIVPGVRITVAGGPFVSPVLREGPPSKFISPPSRPAADRLRLLAAITRSSLVIVGGGGLLNDRLPHFYRPFTRVIRVASLLRRPVLLYAIGVHPPETKDFEAELRALARRPLHITVRDTFSQEILGAYGVPSDVVLDPAFAIRWPRPVPKSHTSRRRLLINLRPWWHTRNSVGGISSHRLEDMLDEIARTVNDDQPDEVVLLSMSSHGDDDWSVLTALRSRLQLDASFSVERPTSMRTLAAAYDSVSAAIVMRLHAAIFALRSGVPTVALGYDEKVSAVLSGLGVSPTVLNLDQVQAQALSRALRSASAAPPMAIAALEETASAQLVHHLRAVGIGCPSP